MAETYLIWNTQSGWTLMKECYFLEQARAETLWGLTDEEFKRGVLADWEYYHRLDKFSGGDDYMPYLCKLALDSISKKDIIKWFSNPDNIADDDFNAIISGHFHIERNQTKEVSK